MCLEDTVRIPLRAKDGSIRAYALVDADDAAWANRWRWSLDGGYARRNEKEGRKRRPVFLHRDLMGLSRHDGFEVDHVDRDKLNCRRTNLRVLLKGKNNQNVPTHQGSASPYRGVRLRRDGRWEARVSVDGKRITVGYCATEEEAARAARDGRRRLLPYAID